MTYYRLLDPKRKGTIARADGINQQQFVPGKGWVRSGVLLEYFWPESDVFERYEEISEKEALAAVGETS